MTALFEEILKKKKSPGRTGPDRTGMVNYPRAPQPKPCFCLIIGGEIGKTLFIGGKNKKKKVDVHLRRTEDKARVHSADECR